MAGYDDRCMYFGTMMVKGMATMAWFPGAVYYTTYDKRPAS